MNPWMETLTTRFGDYITDVVDNNVYFDFMTLFRRVVSNKTLMNPDVIFAPYKAVMEASDLTREEYEKIVNKSLIKVNKVFARLDKPVTPYQMRLSSFTIADQGEMLYSPMLYFWIFVAANAFGGPIGDSIMQQILEKTFIEKYGTPEWGEKLATRVTAKEQALDLLEMTLVKVDERLTSIHRQLTEGRPPLDSSGNHHYTLQ